MKTREIQNKGCFSCPYHSLIPSPSKFKKISGTTTNYCKYYREELSDITEKPDFCKIEKISITEKD